MLPLARKKSHLDVAPRGRALGRDNAPQIVGNKLGPSCHLDEPPRVGQPKGTRGAAASAARDGARTPRVAWNVIQRG